MKRSLTALSVLVLFFTLQVTALAQSASREDLQKQLEAKRAELQKLEDQFLAPSDEDRTAFAELLKQPDTGLIRLLPREVYDQFPNKPAKLTIHGGGAYYSFARLTHEYGYGSDIELSSGYLSVGFAGADYGLMTTIGQVPLEEVSLEHPLAAFLASYKPPNDEADARLEHRSLRPAGKIIDGVTYQERLPVQLNTTYLLRSINYEESDVLVAFRVVRRDSDGSVVLAWKLLKKYPKPVLTRSQVAS